MNTVDCASPTCPDQELEEHVAACRYCEESPLCRLHFCAPCGRHHDCKECGLDHRPFSQAVRPLMDEELQCLLEQQDIEEIDALVATLTRTLDESDVSLANKSDVLYGVLHHHVVNVVFSDYWRGMTILRPRDAGLRWLCNTAEGGSEASPRVKGQVAVCTPSGLYIMDAYEWKKRQRR